MRHTDKLDWNDEHITWHTYPEGFAIARQTSTPIFLAYYTHWCPDCHHISGYFHDPRVVALSQSFVMVWANRDNDPVAGADYDVDGTYVPRLQLLTAQGELLAHLQSGREDDVYFYAQETPDALIENMTSALTQ